MHAPIKRRQKRLKLTPWMMPDLLGLIQVRDKLHTKFMRDKTSKNWLSYKQARNYATTAMRMAKRTLLTSAVNNSKKFWSNISQCTGISGKRRIEPPWPSSSPAICKASGEAINNFFSSAVLSITSLFIPPCENDVIRSECPEDCTPASQATPFTLQHVTAGDVTKAVKALTSSATTTRDQISLKLLRFSLSAISLPLSLIFNMSIDSCFFPTAWKMGQIIPIHNKGNRSDLANYRPITLLPLLSKTHGVPSPSTT